MEDRKNSREDIALPTAFMMADLFIQERDWA